jgi:ABC-type phosphate transport system substrate-binding protein
MRSRSKLMAVGAAITVAGLNLALIAPASADVAPNSHDIVGVGSDTVQNIANFMADGDPTGASSGVNSANPVNRLFSFDATPDANDRAGYANGSTVNTPIKLNPTIVMRAGTNPVQRPNGSGAGINALIADTPAAEAAGAPHIDFVRMSRLPDPTTGEQSSPIGPLRVIKISTDNLVMAGATVTHAPTSLPIATIVQIYKCTVTDWSAVTGSSGAGLIVPLWPQAGSGTGKSFLADLQAGNGGVAFTPGTCAHQVEENDPSAINTIDTIAPMSEGRFNMYAPNWSTTGGYFHNPVPVYPGGVALTSGIQLLNAAGSWSENRGLYIVFRNSDVTSTTKFQSGGNLNFVEALFYNPANPTGPYAAGGDAAGAIAAGGAVPAYKNCGSGTGVTTC